MSYVYRLYELCKLCEFFYEPLKITWNLVLNLIFSVLKNFSKDFHQYIRWETQVIKLLKNHSKLTSIVLNIFFVFKIFSNTFCGYIRMENQSYKNENI